MALGTTASILLGLGASGAAFGVSKLMTSKQQISAPAPLPQPPSPTDAMAKAGGVVKKKTASMSSSIYTSPLGVAGEAQVARKVLLGQ